MNVEGNSTTDKGIIANTFNKFFVGAASRLLDSAGRAATSVFAVEKSKENEVSHRQVFKFKDVSQNFVLSQLRSLKVGKAVGLDDIPPRLLKDAAGIIANPLTVIINASLHQAKVPLDWKAARVIPLFKKGKVSEMDNYRPISILPSVSKLLERTIHNQLVCYLHEHKLLSPYQCGFRKGHSTEFATLSFADTIRRNIDLGQLTGAVFVDLRKAFDTVEHSTLLQKLTVLGVIGHENEWFREYLSNRSQAVSFNGTLSEQEFMNIGVPQGSILGPLLFVLYVNDLPNVIRHCNILLYADDTVLFTSSGDVSTIVKKLNDDLKVLVSWLKESGLLLNTSKTESVLFGTHAKLKNVEDFSVQINGHELKRVTEFKYLGVVFDQNISWNAHVKYVLAKAGKRVGMLGRIRHNLTVHCANIIYLSYIRPILDYCDTVYHCCGEMNSKSLEKLQRRAARKVCNSYGSDDALDFLKWELLSSRREHHTNNLVKKCLSGRCPQFFRNYFKFNCDFSKYETRQNHLLHLPKVRTEVAKRSFYYNGCIVYNKFKS